MTAAKGKEEPAIGPLHLYNVEPYLQLERASMQATRNTRSAVGDSINIYSEVEWDKHFTQASGFFVMTGGTGRFEGATGYGAESVGAFDPAIGARVLTWDGVIDFLHGASAFD